MIFINIISLIISYLTIIINLINNNLIIVNIL